jgi:hypothetical protein
MQRSYLLNCLVVVLAVLFGTSFTPLLAANIRVHGVNGMNKPVQNISSVSNFTRVRYVTVSDERSGSSQTAWEQVDLILEGAKVLSEVKIEDKQNVINQNKTQSAFRFVQVNSQAKLTLGAEGAFGAIVKAMKIAFKAVMKALKKAAKKALKKMKEAFKKARDNMKKLRDKARKAKKKKRMKKKKAKSSKLKDQLKKGAEKFKKQFKRCIKDVGKFLKSPEGRKDMMKVIVKKVALNEVTHQALNNKDAILERVKGATSFLDIGGGTDCACETPSELETAGKNKIVCDNDRSYYCQEDQTCGYADKMVPLHKRYELCKFPKLPRFMVATPGKCFWGKRPIREFSTSSMDDCEKACVSDDKCSGAVFNQVKKYCWLRRFTANPALVNCLQTDYALTRSTETEKMKAGILQDVQKEKEDVQKDKVKEEEEENKKAIEEAGREEENRCYAEESEIVAQVKAELSKEETGLQKLDDAKIEQQVNNEIKIEVNNMFKRQVKTAVKGFGTYLAKKMTQCMLGLPLGCTSGNKREDKACKQKQEGFFKKIKNVQTVVANKDLLIKAFNEQRAKIVKEEVFSNGKQEATVQGASSENPGNNLAVRAANSGHDGCSDTWWWWNCKGECIWVLNQCVGKDRVYAKKKKPKKCC